jgi:hypothetical protein
MTEEVFQIQQIFRVISKNVFFFRCSTLLADKGTRSDTRDIQIEKVHIYA